MTRRPSVLVTDGEQRASLAAVRSLGLAGYAVYVVSARTRSIAAASKYATGQRAVPDPLTDPASFARAVAAYVDDRQIDLLLPISEPSVLALLPVRDEIRALLPFPSARVFRQICNKPFVLETAARLGIGVPAQLVLHAIDDSRAEAMNLRMPIVAKPARSVIDGTDGARTKSSVMQIADSMELDTALAALRPEAYPLLLQERIRGPGVGVFVLLWKGEIIATFGHRRIREKPPSGGVSVVRESIIPDAALLERSIALLRALEWDGVAMVEYKIDERTGVPYLMEINGRLWGSLQLAIDAGVDFPLLLANAALGRATRPVGTFSSGVRLRWLLGDVDHLIARMRHSRAELHLESDAPGRVRALADFLRSFTDRQEVFRWSDPAPACRETIDWLRGR